MSKMIGLLHIIRFDCQSDPSQTWDETNSLNLARSLSKPNQNKEKRTLVKYFHNC